MVLGIVLDATRPTARGQLIAIVVETPGKMEHRMSARLSTSLVRKVGRTTDGRIGDVSLPTLGHHPQKHPAALPDIRLPSPKQPEDGGNLLVPKLHQIKDVVVGMRVVVAHMLHLLPHFLLHRYLHPGPRWTAHPI